MEITVLIGVIGIVLLLALIALGVPIAFSMATIGALGTFILVGPEAAFRQVAMIAWDKGTDFVMVCIPLFIMMGQLVYHAGIASDLYDCVQKWFGRVYGGLAITSVVACAGFGAVTGVSVAAVATMGTMIMPEMRKYKYNGRLATGCLATAGTLAILIPPSLSMVFYGIMTENSIGSLFIAGIIPGIILSAAFCLMIYIRCRINPTLGPPGPSYPWKVRFTALTKLLPIMIIFTTVIGGIYAGIFTPTEASGVGVSGIFLIALIMKRMTWEKFKNACHDTGLISAMVFAIISGGYFIGRFLVVTELTTGLVAFVAGLGINKYLVLVIFLGMYLILGAVLDVYGMMILTLPFVYPIVVTLQFDPIWFGVFFTIMVELALVTPPIGVCVYVINDIAPEVPLHSVFIGIIPFVIITICMVFFLMAFPQVALWLVY